MAQGNSEMKQGTTVTEAHDLNVLRINYPSMSHHATLRYTGGKSTEVAYVVMYCNTRQSYNPPWHRS